MAGERTQFHKTSRGDTPNGLSAENDAVTVGPADMSRVRETTVYVEFGPNTSAGVVTIEAAPYQEYTGTWAQVTTISWAAANRAHYASVTGVHLALRARISTTVVGGTCHLDLVGR